MLLFVLIIMIGQPMNVCVKLCSLVEEMEKGTTSMCIDLVDYDSFICIFRWDQYWSPSQDMRIGVVLVVLNLLCLPPFLPTKSSISFASYMQHRELNWKTETDKKQRYSWEQQENKAIKIF